MELIEFIQIVDKLRKTFPHKDVSVYHYIDGKRELKEIIKSNPNFKGKYEKMVIYFFDYHLHKDKKFLLLKKVYEKMGITFSMQHVCRYNSL
jgi:hypothetical protein